MTQRHAILHKHFTMYKNQMFYKGFLFKQFPFKQIESDTSIKPNSEELSNFRQTIQKPSGVTRDDSSDEEQISRVIQDALNQGGSCLYAKGDKISVTKGDFTGLKGAVVAIEDNGQLTFKPIGYP